MEDKPVYTQKTINSKKGRDKEMVGYFVGIASIPSL
jgi:hypothetical protein